jgi:hypothetical protein
VEFDIARFDAQQIVPAEPLDMRLIAAMGH